MMYQIKLANTSRDSLIKKHKKYERIKWEGVGHSLMGQSLANKSKR